MGIPIGSLKPSKAILYNGELYIVVGCEHAKLGRGSAFCRTKLRNLKTGQTLEVTLRDSDNVEDAFVESRSLQYLYRDGDIFHFLDLETYEDLVLDAKHIDNRDVFLKDNLMLSGIFHGSELIDLDIPKTIELTVTETSPGFRGDTVKMGTKPATLETGLTIQVPLFIEAGETIKVDTVTRQYNGRA